MKNEKFNRISTTNMNYSLIHTKGGDYGYTNGILLIKKDNQVVARIVKKPYNGYRHNCYGWYKDTIISGGMNGNLLIYNRQGRKIASLVGHTGEILSIALDGDRLVSGSSDQTIKIWDLSKLKMKSEKSKFVKSFFFNQKWKKFISTKYPNIDIRKEDDIKKLYKNLLRDYGNKEANKLLVRKNLFPQLTLFITKTNDWIVWTPQGFYNASKGGEKYIGYHINHGSNHEAEFLTIDRFQPFHRPDLIEKALNGEDLTPYAKAINIDKLLSAGIPPRIEIVNPIGEFNNPNEKGEYRVDVEVCSQNRGLLDIKLYRNGTAIGNIDKDSRSYDSRKIVNESCSIMSKTISLENGVNTIGVRASTEENVDSNYETRIVSYKAVGVVESNLHILTLSVDTYKDRSLKLYYANNDAEAIVSEIKKIATPIFKDVYSYALKDSQVTKGNILKKFKELGEVVKKDDVFVLFISGHGDLDETTAKYYFIPYDCPNGSDLSQRAISQETLLKALSNVQTRKSVVMLDTCKSGGFINKKLEEQTLEQIKERSGRAILSASTKMQYAKEGFNGHGAFTSTLLDGIQNSRVYGYDNKLTITELADYVQNELPKKAKIKNHIQNAMFFKDNNNVQIWIGGK